MNFQIRTRHFENYSKLTRCHLCNTLVPEDMLPNQRF